MSAHRRDFGATLRGRSRHELLKRSSTSSWSAAARPARPPPTISRARPQGRAHRPGRTHQALRRRDPAAADQRLRHPGPPPQSARQPGDDDLAARSAASTCRSTAASSAWSTARNSTNGCARAPSRPARRGSPADSRPITRDRRRSAAHPFRTEGRGAGAHGHSRARIVIGADGANSSRRTAGGARARKRGALRLRLPRDHRDAARRRRRRPRLSACEIYYRGALSPDFYAWIFPHGDTMSVGTGSAQKGFSLKSVGSRSLRSQTGLSDASARFAARARPIPRSRCPAGTTAATSCSQATPRASSRRRRAKASTTRCSAGGSRGEAAEQALVTGDARALGLARKHFMKAHGRVFWILGIMQYFWYGNDKRARAVRQHVPRHGRPAPHLGSLHEQGTAASRPDRARAHLLQGSRPSPEARAAMIGARSRRDIEIAVAARGSRGRRGRRRTDDRDRALVREPDTSRGCGRRIGFSARRGRPSSC